jgi:post-segregation antitoxin (ccd killing protein)
MTLKGNWQGHRDRTAVTDKKNGATRYVTVLIPANIYNELAQRARVRDIPIGAMTRELIERAISEPEGMMP